MVWCTRFFKILYNISAIFQPIRATPENVRMFPCKLCVRIWSEISMHYAPQIIAQLWYWLACAVQYTNMNTIQYYNLMIRRAGIYHVSLRHSIYCFRFSCSMLINSIDIGTENNIVLTQTWVKYLFVNVICWW